MTFTVTAQLASWRRRENSALIVAVAVFLAAAAATLYWSQSMAGGMRMPGGWTMSMAWMPMGGRLSAAVMFAGMWLAMMVAMMLPSTLPMLLLYRRAVRFRREAHPDALIAVMAGGYFGVWTAFGGLAYAAGAALAALAMRSEVVSRAMPVATGFALFAAGVYQLTAWKAACLRHCRDPLSVIAAHLHSGWCGALRLGIHHGAFCAACCWALMLIQLVLGVMNLAVMAAVAVVIALEKLLPQGLVVARLTGVMAVGAGALIVSWALFT